MNTLEKSVFSYTEPHLREIKFKINEESKKNINTNDDEKIAIKFESKVSPKNAEETINLVELTVIIGDEEMAPLFLEFIVCANFKSPLGVDSESSEIFLKKNAIALLYGYVRQMVAIITNGAGISPPINLPFANFS